MTSTPHIFISHASADDNVVKELRIKLTQLNLNVWVDSQNLRGGDKLKPEIEQAIKDARQVIIVISPATINSDWVFAEIELAEHIAQSKPNYRLIPLMLPGISEKALKRYFSQEPVGEKIALEPGKLQAALPRIMAALGERLPDDFQAPTEVAQKPIAELIIELSEPKLQQLASGQQQLSATAELVFTPADLRTEREIKSKPFRFIAPIGPIELAELCWYLEEYHTWPTGLFRERAQKTEAQLPYWGQQLFAATLGQEACHTVLNAWQQARSNNQCQLSIRIDQKLPHDANAEQTRQSNQAASQLQSLPWELLHNQQAYLNQGAHPAHIRRRLPNYAQQLASTTELPIRVLLITARPEAEGTSYIDHRASALPLIDAVESLGDLIQLSVLSPATLPALTAALQQAKANNSPYHVVHFDGHGIYDPQHGLGALCFEDANDSNKLDQRGVDLVYADKLAALLQDYRIPLVFLEACQSAQTDADPNASVAAKLLQQGISSVVAMSHSVLVETAKRFVAKFYLALAQGHSVGSAMLAGQQALQANSYRLPIIGAGELHLQDWFVPMLYQEQHDPQLFKQIPSQMAQRLQAQQQQNRLGELPDTPAHHFVGRSRELLHLERLLEQQAYGVIRGQGGAGKTTLAVELARWLVRSQRFERCAFVSVEQYSHDRAVLDSLGKQLVGEHYLIAQHGNDRQKALQPIQRILENESCLLVLDNMESLIAGEAKLAPVLALCQQLLPANPKTRLIFTSREPLPHPFQHKPLHLGALSLDDAKALVMQVMNNQGLDLRHDDQGKTPQEVDELLNAVGCHARALVLIARELAQQGVNATTDNIKTIMQQLHNKHPDEREKSLFASVELSLQRLSPQTRKQIQGLAMFHGGGHLLAMAWVLEIEAEQVAPLIGELINTGLANAEGIEYQHIGLDPALANYLSLSLTPAQQQHYQQRWMQAMGELLDYLYQQQAEDAKLAVQLTQLELPNLMAYLALLAQALADDSTNATQLADKAGSLEQLLANLNQPQALAQVVSWRQQAAEHLTEWSTARFANEGMNIERLLQQNDLPAAYQNAQALLQQCQQAGAQAYKNADYDLAMAHTKLGEVLRKSGAAAEALPHLQQAQQQFEQLAETGNQSAAHMGSVTLTEQADCLSDLGQLDAAAVAYQEAIKRSEQQQDMRQVAVVKGQLAYVYLLQKDYAAALQDYQDALAIFQQLDEPSSVAGIWHQIGMLYREKGDYPQAEQAYRQSLSIRSQQGNQADEAASLGELGVLYKNWNRLEEAVDFYRQALDIYAQLGDNLRIGRQCSNLANTLIKLKRYQQARPELERAIECKQVFGHAAEPWVTWCILHDLEQAEGNPQAAQQARQQAMQLYLAYRRDGGENHSGTGRLCLAVAQAMQQGDTQEVEQLIIQLLENENWQNHKTLLKNLQAILQGERNPALAQDENLDYEAAAELALLLEMPV